MSTQGMAIFYLKDEQEGVEQEIQAIYIHNEAYPSGFGSKFVEKISSMQPPYKNVEQVILKMIADYNSCNQRENKYLYSFTFVTPAQGTAECKNAGELIRQVVVRSSYSDELDFIGTFDEFEKYVRLEY